MMVAPRPIFNATKNVKGYSLWFQIGNALLQEARGFTDETSVDSPFISFVNKIGLEALTMHKFVFIPVTDIHLATDLRSACAVDPSLVILQLNRKNALTEKNLDNIKRLKESGFKIAFRNYYDINSLHSFLPYTDFIFCEPDTVKFMSLLKLVRSHHSSAKIIVKDVDDDKMFQQFVGYGAEFFDGDFYQVPKMSKDNRVSPLKVNYLSLLNQVNHDDFDIDKFSSIVQRDTALAIRFLKMANSSHLHNSKINSLRHAAALIGQNEIRRWITTAVASSLSQEEPSEITRLSLLRARFCEDVAGLFEMDIHKENLFLMGLFSVLDVILDMPIEKALDMVMIPEVIREALVKEDNDFAKVYNFVKLYERGDWTEISRIALINDISIDNIANAYYETLLWYGRLINMDIDENELEESEE
jgi:EAL and modified HD-GYP domain-containing signal transduction protein